MVRLRPIKSNPSARLTGLQRLPGVSNYFIGDDPDKWITSVPSYAAVKYENVYPGVDLIYYGNDAGQIEYDFKVAPGADPRPIAMAVEGAEGIELDPAGDLIISTSVGRLRQPAPRLYQDLNGARKEIAGHYKLIAPGNSMPDRVDVTGNSRSEDPVIAFALGDYDVSRELVIDPQLVYATYLGGAAGNFDGAYGIAVDAAGNAYVTGSAESTDFPTCNPFDGTGPGSFSQKAFVSKFSPNGTLLYSTFLGSSASFASSGGSAIAVDAGGAIYVAGTTGPGFPLQNAFQPILAGSTDAFVVKLTPDGASLVYSSFLGGNQQEGVTAIALDATNALYVVGKIDARGATTPVTFPLVNPTQATYGGGDSDAFLAVVAPNGSMLQFSTFLDVGLHATPPRSTDDRISSMLIDPTDGDVFIGGHAIFSEKEPDAAFVARFRRSSPIAGLGGFNVAHFQLGVVLVGLYLNVPYAVAVKVLRALMPGLFETFGPPGARTQGVSTPEVVTLTEGLCRPVPPATTCDDPAVVAFFDQDLGFRRAVPVGVLRDFYLTAGTVDFQGAVYLVGDTTSRFLHTVNPIQPGNGGGNDIVVAVLAPGAFEPAFVTYPGGSGTEVPLSIAVDPLGNIYIAGVVTLSPDFPTTTGAFQRELKGRNDAFIAKISPVSFASPPPTSTVPPTATASPTASPSPTGTPIGTIGGRGFSLQTNPGGPAIAQWTDGTVENGYVGYRINLSIPGVVFFPSSGTLPPDATTFTDPTPTDIACYVALVLVGPVTHTSDAICLFRLAPSGNPPRDFKAQLDQTTTTTLTWSPPQGGGHTGYSFQVIPLSGPLPPAVPLAPGETMTMHNTGGQVTCYLLTAQGGNGGSTDALCAYPNGSTIGSGLVPGRPPNTTIEQLRDRFAPLAPRR